jgi:hypothetical protein
MSKQVDWLDTETQAQLAALPPEKLAPPAVAGFSLVLLERGKNAERVDRTLRALVQNRSYNAPPCPCVILRELTLTDALQAQFELICTDSISIFINGEVLKTTDKSYLNTLFKTLRASQEFQPVKIHVQTSPDDDRGAHFLQQFFGDMLPMPITQIVARKKARIMQHWGAKLGIDVEVQEEETKFGAAVDPSDCTRGG